jgi:ribosomal protein S18 acetylase RimI-like enzyme
MKHHAMPEPLAITLIVTIRPARYDDLRMLEWFGLITPYREIMEKDFARARQGEIAYLVAEANGFPIGQVQVDFTLYGAQGIGLIWALRVIPTMQGLGIGTRLIGAAEKLLRDYGFHTAEIGVEASNPDARRLYERLGYVVVREVNEPWQYTTPDGEQITVDEPGWDMHRPL